jgi:hypothetical protein
VERGLVFIMNIPSMITAVHVSSFNLCLHHIFTQILASKEQTDSLLNYRQYGHEDMKKYIDYCLFGSGIYNHFMGFINCNGVVIFPRYRNSKTTSLKMDMKQYIDCYLLRAKDMAAKQPARKKTEFEDFHSTKSDCVQTEKGN